MKEWFNKANRPEIRARIRAASLSVDGEELVKDMRSGSGNLRASITRDRIGRIRVYRDRWNENEDDSDFGGPPFWQPVGGASICDSVELAEQLASAFLNTEKESRNREFYFGIFVLLIIIGIIGAIAPSFVKARNTSQQNACIGNMRCIDAAKEQYAMEYHLSDGDRIVTASVNKYLKGNTTWICPEGGTYTYGNIGSNPQCSITTPTSHIFGGGRF